MDSFSIFLDVVFIGLILYRQLGVRIVRRRLTLRLPFVLGVIGAFELVDYSHGHHLSGPVLGVLALSFAVGGVALGYVRAQTIKIWVDRGIVLRQGTSLTMALWALSLGLHFASDWWVAHLKGPTGVTTVTALLFVAVTLAVQGAAVQQRAERLVARMAPIDATSSVVDHGWSAPNGSPSGSSRPILDARSEPLSPPARGSEPKDVIDP
jgi:hypothetical protein